MDTQFWDLFRETGEPMGYLLYRAEKQQKKERGRPETEEKTKEPPKGTPTASV